MEDMANIAEKQDIRIEREMEVEVHTYSPDSSMYCFDLKVDKGEG